MGSRWPRAGSPLGTEGTERHRGATAQPTVRVPVSPVSPRAVFGCSEPVWLFGRGVKQQDVVPGVLRIRLHEKGAKSPKERADIPSAKRDFVGER